MWRSDRSTVVQDRATAADIPALNRLFSDSFTDRYRRDGMTAMRVPHLSGAVWRFAIERAGEGAMIWRDSRGAIAAFNMVHRSGTEGWMGPLAVRTDRQGIGLGRTIVQAGIEYLKRSGARVIGLETMPRTVDNIGFYSRLGFLPGPLTISLAADTRRTDPVGIRTMSGMPPGAEGGVLERCARLCSEVAPGIDFGREIALTLRDGLGDLALLGTGDGVDGFILWHSAPLAEGRAAEEARVLKLVARDVNTVSVLLDAVSGAAHRLGLGRVVLRCQTAERELYGRLTAAGWQVLWTDLRLTLAGYDEERRNGLLLSNWEI